jgi:hypothetical protein
MHLRYQLGKLINFLGFTLISSHRIPKFHINDAWLSSATLAMTTTEAFWQQICSLMEEKLIASGFNLSLQK